MGNVVCYPTTMPSSTILRLCSHVKGEWDAVVCVCVRLCVHARSVVHFCLTLCDSMDRVHAREQLFICDWLCDSMDYVCVCACVLSCSCLTLCDSMDCVCVRVRVCVCVCARAQLFISVWLSATPWTIACQRPLCVEFSRQGCCTGLRLAAGNFCQVFSASLRMKFFFLWEQLLSICLTNNNMASLVFIPKLINSKISPKLILLFFHIC